MSLYIKNLAMPGSCKECPLRYGSRCFALRGREINVFTGNFAGRDEECPLVGIPDGHGALIDRALLEADSEYDDGEFWAVSVTQIRNAAVVIPAENEEDN